MRTIIRFMPRLTVVFILLLFASAAEAQWSFEIAAGSALNLDRELRIEQQGLPDLEFDAEYETRGFEGPLYYAWRVGRWNGNHGFEFEFIHHKIFLENLQPEVQSFAVSHGYNLLLGNYARQIGRLILRAGAGVVMAHPETRIRGVFSEPGYDWTGPAVQFSAGTRIAISRSWFINVEGKFTGARARVTIDQGEASVPNLAFHALAGIGFRL